MNPEQKINARTAKQQILWEALRESPKTIYELRDIFNEHGLRIKNLFSYPSLVNLRKAGFIQKTLVAGGKRGQKQVRLTLVNDYGPLPPLFKGDGSVIDRNSGKVVMRLPSHHCQTMPIQPEKIQQCQVWTPFDELPPNPRLVHGAQ